MAEKNSLLNIAFNALNTKDIKDIKKYKQLAIDIRPRIQCNHGFWIKDTYIKGAVHYCADCSQEFCHKCWKYVGSTNLCDTRCTLEYCENCWNKNHKQCLHCQKLYCLNCFQKNATACWRCPEVYCQDCYNSHILLCLCCNNRGCDKCFKLYDNACVQCVVTTMQGGSKSQQCMAQNPCIFPFGCEMCRECGIKYCKPGALKSDQPYTCKNCFQQTNCNHCWNLTSKTCARCGDDQCLGCFQRDGQICYKCGDVYCKKCYRYIIKNSCAKCKRIGCLAFPLEFKTTACHICGIQYCHSCMSLSGNFLSNVRFFACTKCHITRCFKCLWDPTNQCKRCRSKEQN